MNKKSLWIYFVIFSTVFFMYNHTLKNLDKIMETCANYYFKKNEISRAQGFYERAFELGLNETKPREIYVNSIINSPLTVEAQDKLLKFIELPVYDSAKVRAEYFISDFKQKIHEKYPNNYISYAVFNNNIMRWGNNPITYAFENEENVPSYFLEEFRKAFNKWEKLTEHKILFEEVEKNSNITILFDEFNPADNEYQKYVVAYTSPKINLNQLESMEINFYLKTPTGEYFSQNQVYNTALHEIVHALGFMGHSQRKSNLMYLTKDPKVVLSDSRQEPTEADINTLKLLYEIKPEITNTEDNRAKYLPDFVLGNDGEVLTKKIKEAFNYVKKAPNLPSGYIDLAEIFVMSKDYHRAIKKLEQGLKFADTEEVQGMIYYNLALTNFYVDNLDIAKDYLNKSLSISDLEEKRYLLGEILVREGKINEAIVEYSNLISKNPKNIDYTIALANIYVLERKYWKARSVLKNYINNNPEQKNTPRFKSYGILNLGI
ncbi:matrixin family metalloprotease [bacterium]|nr:matrixin family metalloprotease [bacterium]